MNFDLQTSKELDSVLLIYKKHGKQMTFVTNNSFATLNLTHDPKFYVDTLKELKYIEFNAHASGPNENITGYWNITLIGKSFEGFEANYNKRSADKILEDGIKQHDFLQKKFIWKHRWTPWILSGIAVLVSLAALFVSYLNYSKELPRMRQPTIEEKKQKKGESSKKVGNKWNTFSRSVHTKTI